VSELGQAQGEKFSAIVVEPGEPTRSTLNPVRQILR